MLDALVVIIVVYIFITKSNKSEKEKNKRKDTETKPLFTDWNQLKDINLSEALDEIKVNNILKGMRDRFYDKDFTKESIIEESKEASENYISVRPTEVVEKVSEEIISKEETKLASKNNWKMNYIYSEVFGRPKSAKWLNNKTKN